MLSGFELHHRWVPLTVVDKGLIGVTQREQETRS